MGDAAGAKCLTGYLTLTKEKRNNHVRYVKLDNYDSEESMEVKLPECIRSRRIGHWSYGSDTEYDEFGMLAPVTWICNCGSWVKTELLNLETGQYEQLSDDAMTAFLAEHQDCVAMCYNCRKVEVERQGYWCLECETGEHY